MTRLDELVAGITVGTETEAAAEAAFHLRFTELVELPSTAMLAGESVSLLGFDALKRSGRFRARVCTAAGVEIHVALDSLDLPGPKLGSLVAAYRRWVGYPDAVLDDSDTINCVVSSQRIEMRIKMTREAIASVASELSTLDLDEIEQWVGDDDPWGRNKGYWSDGAHRYLELVDELAGLQSAIDEVATTGWRRAAAELTLELFKALEEAGFKYWQHDDVQMVVEHALQRWISNDDGLGFAVYDPAQAVTLFFNKIDHFDLKHSLRRLVVGVAAQARDALLATLVSRAVELGPPKGFDDNRWAGALIEARLEHDELDELLGDLPVGYWSNHDMDRVFECPEIRGDPQRSLELLEQWLHAFEEREGEPVPKWSSVRIHRQTLLFEVGRGDEAVAVLLESLKARPNAAHFFELEKLAAVAQPKAVEEALSLVAADVGALVGVASRLASPAVARHIASRSVDELRVVSSLALEPAASALLSAHPEAAVRVYAALGCRHVDRGKGKYYHLAHKAFEFARDLYLSLDRKSEWDRVVQDIVNEHGRKYSFMPEFRRIAGLMRYAVHDPP